MGGVKKKPISAAEKAQQVAARKAEKKPKDTKAQREKKQTVYIPKIDEREALKILGPMKAITTLSVARAMNIRASIANSLLKSLEARGIVKKVGGYSGHYVYVLVSSAS
jgi:small subunit ribosomal protein S25e